VGIAPEALRLFAYLLPPFINLRLKLVAHRMCLPTSAASYSPLLKKQKPTYD